MQNRHNLTKFVVLFFTGGIVYTLIEVVYRFVMGKPHTHWSMFVLGGIALCAIGHLNEHMNWDMLFQKQLAIATAICLALEFSFGCVFNLWLGLDIWDYSGMPFNILGQVCPQFTLIWIGLAAFAIWFDDFIRWRLFGEEKPYYRFG